MLPSRLHGDPRHRARAVWRGRAGSVDARHYARASRPEGDTKFPAIDPAIWDETARQEHQHGAKDEAGFTTIVYERIRRAQEAECAH